MTPELRARILAAAKETPSATRPSVRAVALAAYLGAAVLSAAIFEWQGGFAHGAGRPAEITRALAIGAFVIALAALTAGTWRGRSSVGRPLAVLVAAAIAVPLATFVWMTAWSGSYVEPFYRFGWRCAGMSLACGLLVAAAGFFARWRSVPVHAAWQGAAIAAGAAAVGGLLVDAWCPLMNAPHVLVGHVAPMLVLGLLGALAGRFVLPVGR